MALDSMATVQLPVTRRLTPVSGGRQCACFRNTGTRRCDNGSWETAACPMDQRANRERGPSNEGEPFAPDGLYGWQSQHVWRVEIGKRFFRHATDREKPTRLAACSLRFQISRQVVKNMRGQPPPYGWIGFVCHFALHDVSFQLGVRVQSNNRTARRFSETMPKSAEIFCAGPCRRLGAVGRVRRESVWD